MEPIHPRYQESETLLSWTELWSTTEERWEFPRTLGRTGMIYGGVRPGYSGFDPFSQRCVKDSLDALSKRRWTYPFARSDKESFLVW